MMNGLTLSNAKVVVELGPGTGVFTEELLNLIGPKTQLLIIEINASFYKLLKEKIQDPRVTPVSYTHLTLPTIYSV